MGRDMKIIGQDKEDAMENLQADVLRYAAARCAAHGLTFEDLEELFAMIARRVEFWSVDDLRSVRE